MNNKYIIRVEHPILRAGLTVETEASERYVVKVLNKILELIREFNKEQDK